MQNIKFPAKHHSTILRDNERLLQFKNAINRVQLQTRSKCVLGVS